MLIAVLEDDVELSRHIEKSLTDNGHDCMTFADGRKLLKSLYRETFDVLILDWNVPLVSGVEIISWTKENLEFRPPTIILTSRSSEEDIVAGLSAGADDYIVKPVSAAVLLARVNARARRAYPAPTDTIEVFGPYVFDTRAETVQLLGSPISLTAKEFALALLLFRNTHRALSRAYLLEAIWGWNPDLPTRTLDAHISNVRTKLNLRPANGYKLVPIYAYGYRLEALA